MRVQNCLFSPRWVFLLPRNLACYGGCGAGTVKVTSGVNLVRNKQGYKEREKQYGNCAHFGSAYTKIGMIQRKLACPLCKEQYGNKLLLVCPWVELFTLKVGCGCT